MGIFKLPFQEKTVAPDIGSNFLKKPNMSVAPIENQKQIQTPAVNTPLNQGTQGTPKPYVAPQTTVKAPVVPLNVELQRQSQDLLKTSQQIQGGAAAGIKIPPQPVIQSPNIQAQKFNIVPQNMTSISDKPTTVTTPLIDTDVDFMTRLTSQNIPLFGLNPVTRKQYAEAGIEESKFQDLMDTFQKGFNSLFQGTKKAIYGPLSQAAESLGIISPETKKVATKKYENILESEKQELKDKPYLAPRKERNVGVQEAFENGVAKDPGYWANMVSEMVGQVVATVPITVVGGVLGGPVGAGIGMGITSYGPTTADLYQDLRDNGLDDKTAGNVASVVGVPMAALDFLSEKLMLSKIPGVNKFIKNVKKEATEEIVRYTMKQISKKGAAEFAKTSLTEGGTEAAQQIIQNATVKVFNQDRDLMAGVLDSFVVGAVGSSPFATLGMKGKIDELKLSNEKYRNMSEEQLMSKVMEIEDKGETVIDHDEEKYQTKALPVEEQIKLLEGEKARTYTDSRKKAIDQEIATLQKQIPAKKTIEQEIANAKARADGEPEMYQEKEGSAIDYTSKELGLTQESGGLKYDEIIGDSYILKGKDSQLQISINEKPNEIQVTNIHTKELGDLTKVAQGTGLGTEVLNKLKDYADVSGKKLTIAESTPGAKTYYEKLGFLKPDDTVYFEEKGEKFPAKDSYSYEPVTPNKQAEKMLLSINDIDQGGFDKEHKELLKKGRIGQGVDFDNKIYTLNKAVPAKEIYNKLSAFDKANIDQSGGIRKGSSAKPILAIREDGTIKLIDGTHALVHALKENKNLEYYSSETSFQEKSYRDGKAPVTQDEAQKKLYKLAKTLIDNGVLKQEALDRIVTPQGLEAYGKYKDAMISFAKDPIKSTAPHEAFHAFFDLLFTTQEKSAYLAEIMDTQKIDNIRDAEEWMADKFAEEADRLMNGKPSKYKGKIAEMFSKFWEAIRTLFGNKKDVDSLFAEIMKRKENIDYVKKAKGEEFLQRKQESFQEYDPIDTQNFKNRFGDWKKNPEKASKVVDDEGKPLVVYHGTVKPFEAFDKSKAFVESDLGAGFYFTDDESDVSSNYHGGGPDYDNKVARLAERIESDSDGEMTYEQAKVEAKKQLGEGAELFEVYLNIKNPVIIGNGEKGGQTRLFEKELETGIERDQYDSYEEFEIAEEEARNEAIDEIYYKINRAAGEYGVDASRILADLELYEPISAIDFVDRLKKSEAIMYAEDGDGNFAGNEIIRSIFEELGYDGIIDHTVADKFKNMNIPAFTTHYIAFKPNQIKSAKENQGTFDPYDDRIKYSAMKYKDEPLYKEIKNVLEELNDEDTDSEDVDLTKLESLMGKHGYTVYRDMNDYPLFSVENKKMDIMEAQTKIGEMLDYFGIPLIKNSDGTIKLFHGTDAESAAAILKEGNESEYYTPSLDEEVGGVNGAIYYGKHIVEFMVDPRYVNFDPSGEFTIRTEDYDVAVKKLKMYEDIEEAKYQTKEELPLDYQEQMMEEFRKSDPERQRYINEVNTVENLEQMIDKSALKQKQRNNMLKNRGLSIKKYGERFKMTKHERSIAVDAERNKVLKSLEGNYVLDADGADKMYDQLRDVPVSQINAEVGKQVRSAVAYRAKGNKEGEAKAMDKAKKAAEKILLEKTEERRTFDKSFYDKNQPTDKEGQSIKAQFAEFLSDRLEPISYRLGRISKKIQTRVREFDYREMTTVKELVDASRSFLDQMKALKKDKIKFNEADLALKNRDTEKLKELGIDVPRSVLDLLYEAALSVGLDAEYLVDYFPRIVSNYKGLMDHVKGTEAWGYISDAIKAKENAIGRPLDMKEKAEIANKLLSGFAVEGIKISMKNLKERSIDVITSELNKYYKDPVDGYLDYIAGMVKAIEMKRLFGNEDSDKAIGTFVAEMEENGTITPDKEEELTKILQARFSPDSTSKLVSNARAIISLTSMGSPISTLSQIQDLANSMYIGGLKNIFKAWEIDVKDLGIDAIAQEMNDPSKMQKFADSVFTKTGFKGMDRLGKNVLVNTQFNVLATQAKKNPQKMKKDLMEMFDDEKRVDAIIKSFQQGKLSDDGKFLLFNKLADFQPISQSEMTYTYLKGGKYGGANRLFYTLKSFAIKQVASLRREGIDIMKDALRKKWEAKKMEKDGQITKEESEKLQTSARNEVIKGAYNLIKLAALLMTMGVAVDEIKDFIMLRKSSNIRAMIHGEDITLGDRFIQNALKLSGLSKYSIMQTSKAGIGSALASIYGVPTGAADQAARDLIMIFTNKNLDWMEKLRALESIQSIPVAGKLAYRWFGQPTMTSDHYSPTEGFQEKKYSKDIFSGEISKKKGEDSFEEWFAPENVAEYFEPEEKKDISEYFK